MRRFLKPFLLVLAIIVFLGGLGIGWVLWRGFDWNDSPYARGTPLENLDGVAVYDNGPLFTVTHGRNYAADGYYFGQKWQCVEFIKRYLYTAKGLRMPDVWGHAISFFDPDLPHGALNVKRGMTQYAQGGGEKPRPGDLLVFSGAGGYGHVAIVSSVGTDYVEVVQQNSPPPRERLKLAAANGRYTILGRPALGWLRVPEKTSSP